MADKIFPTDFNKTEQSGISRAAEILISAENATETTYAELGDAVDAITGIDTIPTGEIPIKKSDGTLESSGLLVTDIVTETGSGIANEIPTYSNASAIGNSGLFIKLLTSFGVNDSNGIYPMGNIANGGNALVGKIALGNSTRGLALGLLNNGTTQEAALYPISGGVGSSTPQFLAKQSYVNDYVNYNSAVIVYATLATAAALPAYTRVGNVITADANGALTVDSVTAVVGYKILVKDESGDDNNAVYTVTTVGTAGTPYVLTRDTSTDIIALGAIGERFRPMIVSVSSISTTNAGTWMKSNAYDSRVNT